MSDSAPLTPPTAQCCAVMNGQDFIRVGVDLVTDVADGMVHILVPIGGHGAQVQLGFRLTFTPDQLAALMNELVECSELIVEGAPW